MAIDFPDSPSNGDIHTVSGKRWQWDGEKWQAYGASLAPDVLYVDQGNARVGINDTTPSYSLDVTGTAHVTGDIDVDGTTNLDNVDIDGTINQDGVIGRVSPSGSIVGFGGSSAPTGWLLCDGSAVSRTTYADLFSAISTTYGVGDGSSTFNVPNLKGKVPVGRDAGDASFDVLAETGGASTVTLTSSEMPSHTHTQNSHTHPIWHTSYGYIGNVSGTFGAVIERTGIGNNVGGLWTATATTATNQNTGGGGAHSNLQPYVVINYIIAI
tara:strand:- start:55 stop:861 length:807 start_codon:yes stop_codon:yes gene_type:complete